MKPRYFKYLIKLDNLGYVNVWGLDSKGRKERVSWSGLLTWLRESLKISGLKLHVCHRYKVADVPIPVEFQKRLEGGIEIPGNTDAIVDLRRI
ncbi:MAG: hypothetical protein B5M53_12175 [Candidatus Cloacimonas sp. 4484_209]|nr:MAG: hypothetical protein B5M53_12175 [Candidatus Cloacimonas sp. 4484_209]